MKYKVTKVYIVEASNKAEAVEQVVRNPDSLQYVAVSEVTDKGFLNQVKKQLTGN